MRYSRASIPTLKETRSDAASLSPLPLVRAFDAPRPGPGVHARRPLQLKVARKLAHLVPAKLEERKRGDFRPCPTHDQKQTGVVALETAATRVFELVQQAPRASAAGEAA